MRSCAVILGISQDSCPHFQRQTEYSTPTYLAIHLPRETNRTNVVYSFAKEISNLALVIYFTTSDGF